MFKHAQAENTFATRALRLFGCVLLGDLVGLGTDIVAILLAIASSLLAIGVAWLFYRPLLSLALMAPARRFLRTGRDRAAKPVRRRECRDRRRRERRNEHDASDDGDDKPQAVCAEYASEDDDGDAAEAPPEDD